MSQHDFNIANQSFPATRTDLNNALVALASNSSGDAEPATKYANQWWYETDTNTLKLRNEANDAWISIAVLDQSGNAVQSITTAGLTLGSTAISATGAEINQLDAITRGSILYGNASGATARLAAGAASTVLTSDGTDVSWAAAGGGGVDAVVFPNLASPNNTYTSSGTWSKGSLSDDAYVWIYLVGGGAGGRGDNDGGSIFAQGGHGGKAKLIYGKAKFFDGGTFVIGAGNAGSFSNNTSRNNSTFTLSSSNGGAVFTTTNASNNTVFSIVDGATVTQSTTLIEASPAPSISFLFGNPPTGWSGEVTGSGYVWSGGEGGEDTNGQNGIFGGGTGEGTKSGNNRQGGGSLYAGAGGTRAAQGTDGTVPGGGGGGSTTVGNVGGDGANGNMRVYHV